MERTFILTNFNQVSKRFPKSDTWTFFPNDLLLTYTCSSGQVKVEFNNTNHTVEVGEEISIPSNDTHVVYTVSDTPSCWMYIFTNTTEWNNETIRNWILHPGTLFSKLRKYQFNSVKARLHRRFLSRNSMQFLSR